MAAIALTGDTVGPGAGTLDPDDGAVVGVLVVEGDLSDVAVGTLSSGPDDDVTSSSGDDDDDALDGIRTGT